VSRRRKEAYARDLQWVGAVIRLLNQRGSKKTKDQLRFDKQEGLTHSIVVEPVLSKEHLPKVLADLVPCL